MLNSQNWDIWMSGNLFLVAMYYTQWLVYAQEELAFLFALGFVLWLTVGGALVASVEGIELDGVI